MNHQKSHMFREQLISYIYLIAHETKEIYPGNKFMRRKRKCLKGIHWFKRSPCLIHGLGWSVRRPPTEGSTARSQGQARLGLTGGNRPYGRSHLFTGRLLCGAHSLSSLNRVFGKHKVWEYNMDESLIILISTLMNIPCSAWAGGNISLCFLKD